MSDTQIDYILNDIKAITENVIVKMSYEANLYETTNSKREGDRYVAAMMERDIFSSYHQYPEDVLIKAGLTDPEFISECVKDKYKIPHKKRETVLKYMRQSVIDEYEELNDYYRNLIGKPPLNTPESEYIYLTDAQMEYYKIDEVRPIHDYPLEIIIKLERFVIPDLIKKYPEKTYLKHMGSKAVNIVRAREAKNFEIIFSDIILDNIFLRSFFETYDFCREYFMSVIYNKSLSGRYNLYENFIGMNIMIMTVQRLIVDTIKLSIDRDFYDLISIKKMFECYGIPFFEDLPLDYQRTIIKNLNMLIRSKATDKVLYNISNTLMYERIQIYKYYLVKERKLDENEDPIIVYKTVYDDDGNASQVPDYEKMYDIYFQSTDILEPNVILAIENKPNRYHYNEVTDEDVYWWETEELKKELYEREYNFIETKYLGINLMHNLTNLLYDTCYFLNLLVDNKDTTTPMETRILNADAMKTGTDYLYLILDRFSSIPISIFDSVVILCALVSKKNGMKGNIIANSHAKVLSVLGFNFELDFDLIKETIKKYPRVFKKPEISKYLDLLDIKHVDDIETLYNNFKNFADFCAERIANTENIYEYRAYKTLYKAFTVREETGKAFTMTNGEVAKTYLEYLYDKLPHIAKYIESLHKDKLGVYIEHVIGKLNELIPDIEYLSALNGTNNNIIMALMSLINFFKSYTTDLRNLNVIYIFDDKVTNKIRMVDDPRLFIKLFPEEKSLKYNDAGHLCVKFDKEDNLLIYSQAAISNTLQMGGDVLHRDSMTLKSKMEYDEMMDLIYNDSLHVSNHIGSLNNKLGHYDKCWTNTKSYLDDKYLETHDELNLSNKIYFEEGNGRYNDMLNLVSTKINIGENINIKEMIKIIRE